MQHALQNFQLNFTHQLQVDLAQSGVPRHMQLWILVLQGAQGQKGIVGVSSFRQLHPVVQHRFQHRLAGIRLYAKALSGIGFCGAQHRTDGARRGFADQAVFAAGVDPQLVGLFFKLHTGIWAGYQVGFDFQHAVRHFQVGHARAGFVCPDLEDARAKAAGVRRHAGIPLQTIEQVVNAIQPQSRAKIAGEHLPPRDCRDEIRLRHRSCCQHGFHQRFTAHAKGFGAFFRRNGGGKVHTAIPKAAPQLPQAQGFVRTGQIHFVDIDKGWHMVALQQPPQCHRVALDAVRAGNDQHRIIQHLQRSLGLRRKVHVAGGIQQGDLGLFQRGARHRSGRQGKHGLFGKNGNAAGFFQRIGVQKCIPMVYAPQLADAARTVEQCFRKSGFSAVHVCQNPNDQTFHNFPNLIHSVPGCCARGTVYFLHRRPPGKGYLPDFGDPFLL